MKNYSVILKAFETHLALKEETKTKKHKTN